MYPQACSIDFLSYIDYIIVHSGDFSQDLNSLHAPTPNRKHEMLIRRNLITSGLNLFSQYCLIKPKYETSGVYYILTDESTPFIDSLQEEYTSQVKIRAEWAVQKYHSHDIESLKCTINESLDSSQGKIAFHFDKQERNS